MNPTTIGLDIAKNGVDQNGKVVVRKRLPYPVSHGHSGQYNPGADTHPRGYPFPESIHSAEFQSPRSSPLISTCGSELLIKRLVPQNYFPDFEMFGHPRSRSRPKDPQGLRRHFE